jgi:hypothetical protein
MAGGQCGGGRARLAARDAGEAVPAALGGRRFVPRCRGATITTLARWVGASAHLGRGGVGRGGRSRQACASYLAGVAGSGGAPVLTGRWAAGEGGGGRALPGVARPPSF